MKTKFLFPLMVFLASWGGNIFISSASASCEDNFIYPSSDTRTYENQDLGFTIAIPDNYRTMKKSDDSIEILNPGTYDLIQCANNAGEIGSIRWRTATLEINTLPLVEGEESLEKMVISQESHLSINDPRLINNNGREMLMGAVYDSHYDVDFFVIYFVSADGQSLVKIDGATDSQVVRDSIVTLRLL